ncbi:transposase [Nocardia sp. NPDC051570]|uniref:transposase n=1 Tax=Nocardia sp. NPDC051570 TaxID=3364324 RepID=UPI0037AAA86E
MPSSKQNRGPNVRNNRWVVEGMLYRLRTSVPWRDLPAAFGPRQVVWKRQRRDAGDGTWDRVLTALAALADNKGDLDWAVSITTCGEPGDPARRTSVLVVNSQSMGCSRVPERVARRLARFCDLKGRQV